MFVYLIHQEDSNLYKVGVSKHVDQRLLEHQTGNGNNLEIIVEFKSRLAFKIENLIHKRWIGKNTVGEWFILDEDDVIGFKELCVDIENGLKFLEENNSWFQKHC